VSLNIFLNLGNSTIMITWYKSLSIRWKLQLGFFVVTMITTIFNRLLASSELGKLIHIAEINNVDQEVITQLEASHSAYIFNSFWESGIEFGIQFMIIGFVASLFVRPLTSLVNALKAVEAGDLTQSVEQTSMDEIGELQYSFNEVRKKLSSIMSSIDENGKNMGQSAYQIANISREIAEVSNSEQQRSGEVSSATHQLQDISESVQVLASEATDSANKTEAYAQEGMSKVQKNIAQMEQTAEQVNVAAEQISELEQSAAQIHDIVGTISSIAEQTSLLSLNAAIEAARAGEAGRGFAVVADEVRNLAQNTSSSVGQISGIIDQVTSKVSQVTSTMNDVVEQVRNNGNVAGETNDVIKTMAGEVSNTASGNIKIVEAAREQLSQLDVLQSTLGNLFETLNESSSKVETTATIGDDLYSVTERLNSLMSDFQFESDVVIEADQNVDRKYPRASNSVLVRIKQNDKVYEGLTSDISLGGMQLRLSSQLLTDNDLQLQVYLPYDSIDEYSHQAPLQIKADTVRKEIQNGKHIYGVKYQALNDEQRASIEYCFDYFSKHPTFDASAPELADVDEVA